MAHRLPSLPKRALIQGRRRLRRTPEFTDRSSRGVVANALAVLDAQAATTGRVALVLKVDAVAIANGIAAGLRARGHTPDVLLLAVGDVVSPDARDGVTVCSCATVEARIDALSCVPRVDLLVERGNNKKGQKHFCFARLLPFVRDGGSYVVEDLHLVDDPALDDFSGRTVLELVRELDRINEQRSEPERQADELHRLADAVGSVTISDRRAVVTKRGHHRLKLRDIRANSLLDRGSPDWGSVLAVREPLRLPVRATVTTHGDGPSTSSRRELEVPARYLREYRGALAASRQLLFDDLFFFPDTFRHPMARSLNSRPVVSVDRWTARVRRDYPDPPRALEGRFFHFDTEYPGHFGHVMTEVLSRVPGWRAAEQLFPGIRPLISLDPGQQEIPEFQQSLFRALEIDPASIEYVSPEEVVRVESIVATTPDFVQPHYVAPELRDVWSSVGATLAAQGSLEAERVFVSRGRAGVRRCHDQQSIEDFFAREGFLVVHPQDHSLPDQVSLSGRLESSPASPVADCSTPCSATSRAWC